MQPQKRRKLEFEEEEEIVIEDEKGTNTCVICLENWKCTGDHRVCSLSCGHVFGFKCINKWLFEDNHEVCPICKRQVEKSINPLFLQDSIHDCVRQHFFKEWQQNFKRVKRDLREERKEKKSLKRKYDCLENKISKFIVENESKKDIEKEQAMKFIRSLQNQFNFYEKESEQKKSKDGVYEEIKFLKLKSEARFFQFVFNEQTKIVVDNPEKGTIDLYDMRAEVITNINIFKRSTLVEDMKQYYQLMCIVSKEGVVNLMDLKQMSLISENSYEDKAYISSFLEGKEGNNMLIGFHGGLLKMFDRRKMAYEIQKITLPDLNDNAIVNIKQINDSKVLISKGTDGLFLYDTITNGYDIINPKYESQATKVMLSPYFSNVSICEEDIMVSLIDRDNVVNFIYPKKESLIIDNNHFKNPKSTLKVPTRKNDFHSIFDENDDFYDLFDTSLKRKYSYPSIIYETFPNVIDDDVLIEEEVQIISKTPERKKLISQSIGKTVVVYNCNDNKKLQELRQHKTDIQQINSITNSIGHFLGYVSHTQFSLFAIK